MTHDELLAKIEVDRLNDDAGFLAQALRAVVELHKPVEGYEHLCSACCFGDGLQAYPCQTIVAIEKELN